jgi:hypothetical protein
MRQILLRYGVPLGTQLVQHRLHVHGIPDDHGIGDHVETQRLVRLGFILLAPNHPFVTHKEKIAECMQCLPFVSLGIDAATVIRTLEIAEDEEGLAQATVFLKRPRKDVLAGVGLQLADEQ